MSNFWTIYQHLPERISPQIFSIGSFSIGWYAFMYLAAFLTVWGLLGYRLKRQEDGELFRKALENKNLDTEKNSSLSRKKELVFDLLLVGFFGAIIGGRIGYVLFYNFPYFWAHPLAIVSPFDPLTGEYIGIYGMSYHGGLLGAVAAGWWLAEKQQIDFWALADFIIPAFPAGYFFGRLGNFLNGELYGRVTDHIWGMYFPSDPLGRLRYPSQLFEALLEGLVLSAFLWSVRNRKFFRGKLLAWYLIGYALARLVGESFRQPDPQIGYLLGGLTLGQWFSAGMLVVGIWLLAVRRKTVFPL